MKTSVFITALLALALVAAADAPPDLFDPARHMHVSEVTPGMTGYGLSVFRGTTIERFDVKVLAVLKNFNPKYDVILVDCKGANLEHTGSIAGMSGSPIFLQDAAGKFRMVGAFAYGWPLMKDPVGGVQPIEYMLGVNTQPPKPQVAAAHTRWSLDEARNLLKWNTPAPHPLAAQNRLGGDVPSLQPLATPLMVGGISAQALARLAPALAPYGMVPLEAGGGAAAKGPIAKMEPGSVLAVPLVTGDVEMTAVGTVTEVLGDRVFGFGHSFNNEGPISLPMGTGEIDAVIAELSTSFKIGTLTQIQGTLLGDQTVGVAGRLGEPPPLAPMDLNVTYADGVGNQAYHFNLALHPRMTPLMAAAALEAALSGTRDLPQYHTVDYDLDLQFEQGQSIHVVDTMVNGTLPDLSAEVGLPIVAASDNPFARVMLKSVKGTVRVTSEAREAKILSVSVPRAKYQPGEIAHVFVSYLPFRGAESILPIDFEIPRDLADGQYPLAVSDWDTYMDDERQIEPFRFTAQNTAEVFAALKDLMALRHNAVYVQLLRSADGVAIGRTAMPHLPASRRQVLLEAGLSDTTPFISSNLKIVPTDAVMQGSAVFTITVDRQAKVQGPTPHPAAQHDTPPNRSPVAPAKPDEPKPKSAE